MLTEAKWHFFFLKGENNNNNNKNEDDGRGLFRLTEKERWGMGKKMEGKKSNFENLGLDIKGDFCQRRNWITKRIVSRRSVRNKSKKLNKRHEQQPVSSL